MKLVQYYDPNKGWRNAWLVRQGRKWAYVQKIKPIGKVAKRNTKVAVADIREV